MWINELWRRWFGRTRPLSSVIGRRCANHKQKFIIPRLEVLEDRTLLSAPAPFTLSNIQATNQGGIGSSGTYFLGTQIPDVGGTVGGSYLGTGASLSLNLSGQVGLNLGYSASAGQVSSTYSGVSLQQNYVTPTQFNQEVNFTPQNTNVSYSGGSFSTTGLSLSASAALADSINGSIGATLDVLGHSTSGSKSFSGSTNQQLFNIGIGSTGASNGNDVGLTSLTFLGHNFANELNAALSSLSLSASVTPFGPEVPVILTGSLSGQTNPLGLSESLSVGVGEGAGNESAGVSSQVGSMNEYVPDINLNTNSLQNNGVLTATGTSTLAALNLQMGSLVAGIGSQDTLSVGPASVTFTPVSFQMSPTLSLVQTSTITPTSQLTYNFSKPVVVTLDGQVQNSGKPESSVTFTPGVDTLSILFNGNPITVTPTWTFTESYTTELSLDVSLLGTLTAGEISAAIGPVSTPTLGPLYTKNFTFTQPYQIANIYDNTSTIETTTKPLSSFTIGSTFKPSLAVTLTSGSGSGTLPFAVDSANLENTSSPQIIHLGPGTYNLTQIAKNSSGASTSSGLYVTAQNLIIEGAGLGQTIIKASSGLGGRVFDVASGANLTLQGVTVEGGSAGSNQDGGGILNSGTLTISDSTITDNSANNGGGIYNSGIMTISDSTISDNFANNYGGGIVNSATLTIGDSTISGNTALSTSGGGVFNSGTLTIGDSTIADNSASAGGGFFNNSGTLMIGNSTIADNSASVGGGIYNLATLTIGDTIVAGNSFGYISDIYGSVNGDYNLIGDGSGESGISNGSNGNLVGQQNALLDPMLAPLGNYGGLTETMALLPGSPAIDAGTSTVPGGLPLTDQRGFARTVNGQVDIGAVEYQYDLGLTGYVTPGTTPGTVQYSYTVTNNGPDPVAGTTLTVPLPQGTAFQSQTSPTGWTESDPGTGSNGTVTFTDSNTLRSGQSANFTITALLQNTTVGAVLSNTATVGPTTSDNNLQNNSLTLTITNEQEGQTFNKVVLFHFNDPNPNETAANDFTATVSWGDNSINSSNDGTGTVSVVADPNGGFNVVGSHAYAEEGQYGIAVSVTGLDGTIFNSGEFFTFYSIFPPVSYTDVIDSQQIFAVADAPLTAGALTPPPNAAINQPITNAVLFHFTDANPNGTVSDYTATVSWGDGKTNSSNDGSGSVSVVADPNGGFNVVGSHTYTQFVNPGTFSVQVSDAGGADTSASDNNFRVLYPDQPLTAGKLYVPSVTTEGQSISKQLLFHFTDADPNAQASDYLATVSWGDGKTNNSNDGSGSVSVVADPNGGFNVYGSHVFVASTSNYFAVKVTDLGDLSSPTPDLGGQSTGAIDPTPLNISNPAVVVKAGSTFTSSEKTLSAVQTIATFTDPAGPDTNPSSILSSPYIATIQWGDGTVTVADSTAQSNYTNATVNSKGQITGQLVSVENVGGIVLGSNGKTFSVNLAHKYAVQGNYTITILLNHEGVLSPPVTTTAMVAGDDRLTATGGAVITSTYGEGITNATVATFTDTDTISPAADFKATITWGDGRSSSGTIVGGNGNFTVMGSHNYASVGDFPIGVTISNFVGTATATASTSATIKPATPTVRVTDAGGTYNDQPFPATGTAVGVDGITPVSGTFSYAYYTGNSASGTPSTTAPINAGTYTVVADFTSSDPNYTNGRAQATFTIAQAATTTAGTTSPNPVYSGQTVTLTANVSALAPSTATPVGTVDFFDTTTQTDLGSVGLSNGTAQLLTTVPMLAGTQTITLTYKGNANFIGSSTTVTITILPSLYVLNASAPGALTVSGDANINVSGLVQVDSNSKTALKTSGNAHVTASAIDVSGGFQTTGHAAFSVTPTSGLSAPDPLAGLTPPSSAGLANEGSIHLGGNSSLTINPGIYNQIVVSGNATLKLNPGIYIIDGGGMKVSGNAHVSGAGVLIYNAGNKGIIFSGNATIGLSAATTGSYAGIVLFQAHDNDQSITVSGNANVTLNGAIYAANAQLILSGDAQLFASSLVVGTMLADGNSHFNEVG